MRIKSKQHGALIGLVGIILMAWPALAPFTWAQNSAKDNVPMIRLRATTFAPAPGYDPAVDQLTSQDDNVCLVQFSGPILAEWRAGLEATGALILDYIPDYAYKVHADRSQRERIARLEGVRWVGAYQPDFKISPEAIASGSQALRVELQEGAEGLSQTTLANLGVRIIGRDGNTWAVGADTRQAAALSRLPQVRWIEPLTVPRLHNDIAAGEISAPQAWSAGYAGEGQTIAVADTGLDTGSDYPQITGDMHRDLDNRVAHISSWPISPLYYEWLDNPLANDGAADRYDGHGTHVAGSAVGNGYLSNGQYRGVAYRAALTFQALEQYCNFNTAAEGAGWTDGYYLVGAPTDLADLYNEAYQWGARVHTNSWGLDRSAAGVYNSQAQQTDRFVWEHRDMAILFSVGNEALDANRDGRADAGSVVPPATAKNIIAVGATENRRPSLDTDWPYANYSQFWGDAFPVAPIAGDPMADAGSDGLMASSGRGPLGDGRLAPHVVAPGSWVASLRSSLAAQPGWPASPSLPSGYMYLGGTSMSAPLVAGGVALTRQAYLDRGHTPSAALLKATIIQTARDIPGQYAAPYNEAGPIPNNNEGWGAVNLAAAVAGGRAFVDEQYALQTGQEYALTYRASAAAQPARFTLVWTDYPAAVEAATQLVNDLDLEVTAPNGQIYRGNVFLNGWSATGGSADRTNNVECVYLPTSLAGTYTVRVRAHNIPQGPQNFALLMSGAPTSNRVTLPLAVRRYGTAAPTPTRSATPSRTATPSYTPTVTPMPTFAPGEFRDDFSQITGLWPVTTTASYTMGYEGGEYRIQIYPVAYKKGALPGVSAVGGMLLEVDGHAVSEAPQGYGLLFAYQTTPTIRYYAFIVSPTGYYAMARYENDVEYTITPWTASAAINLGSAVNRLSVQRVGQQVECRINGTLAQTLSGSEFAGVGRVGLFALCAGEPYADARYDSFRLLPLSGADLSRQDEPQIIGGAANGALGQALLAHPPRLLNRAR